MPIWKIANKTPTRVEETGLKEEKLLEEHLEDWIVHEPSILGESLLVIGRQVLVPDTKDRLDILALDPQGNTVIIELKRGKLGSPVDMQALRYASYISKWTYENLETQARSFLAPQQGYDFNFNSVFEDFCERANVDEVPPLNQDQRIIIVGSSVKEKLGSVALWLREHTIEIKVIEVQLFKEGTQLFLQPTPIVPAVAQRFADTGRPSAEALPWKANGREWHLEKRCSAKTRALMEKLDAVIRETLELDDPKWNQKLYVAYPVDGMNWLWIETRPNHLKLNFVVRAKSLSATALAKDLGVAEFDPDESLAEKLGLSSSVGVKPKSTSSDRVVLRIKEGFDVEAPAFAEFLRKVRAASGD